MFMLSPRGGAAAGVTARAMARARYVARQRRAMASQPTDTPGRIDRIATRMPRFLRRYLEPLRNAPLTHVSAFLLLHELTAIVPLFGLAGIFHYYNYLPPYITEGELVAKGVEKFGNYFRRKGWLGDVGDGPDGAVSDRAKWWGRGEGSFRIVTEFATAYAITKILLPLRLVLSVWGTPWFARSVVTPFASLFGRLFKKSRKGGKTAHQAAITPSTTAKDSVAIGPGTRGPRLPEPRQR